MRSPHLAVVEVNGEPEEEAGLSETFPTSHLKMGLVNSRVLGSVCRMKWSHQRFFFSIYLVVFLCLQHWDCNQSCSVSPGNKKV